MPAGANVAACAPNVWACAPVCTTPPDHGHAVVEGEVGTLSILGGCGGRTKEINKIVKAYRGSVLPIGGAPLDGTGGVGDAGGSRSRRGIDASAQQNTREMMVSGT